MMVFVIGPASASAIANDLDVVLYIQYCSGIDQYMCAVN